LILEVCVDSVESAVAAEQGGAERIELCADLVHGGITPSIGMIKAVRGNVSLKIHVMIRPRRGDFCYSESEFKVMKTDIREVRNLGIDGVVFGILNHNGAIDVGRTASLIQIARPLSVTFHRAFDESVDLDSSLSELIRLGVDRVLTSGGEPSVESGLHKLAELVRNAGSSVKILAGGGITLENVARVVESGGIEEVHVLSAVSSTFDSASAEAKFFHSSRSIVDATKVRRIVDILQRLSPRN
jgi:copper homeostasis protein